MINSVLSLIIVSIFIGCSSSNEMSHPSTELSLDKLYAQSYSLHHKATDEEANRYIDTLLVKYKDQFLVQISDAALESGYILSKDETDFLLDVLVFDFKYYLKKDILKDIKKDLKTKFEETLKELNLKESEDVTLSEFEKNIIKEISLNYFDEQPILDERIDTIAKESLDRYLKSSQDQSKSS